MQGQLKLQFWQHFGHPFFLLQRECDVAKMPAKIFWSRVLSSLSLYFGHRHGCLEGRAKWNAGQNDRAPNNKNDKLYKQIVFYGADQNCLNYLPHFGHGGQNSRVSKILATHGQNNNHFWLRTNFGRIFGHVWRKSCSLSLCFGRRPSFWPAPHFGRHNRFSRMFVP